MSLLDTVGQLPLLGLGTGGHYAYANPHRVGATFAIASDLGHSSPQYGIVVNVLRTTLLFKSDYGFLHLLSIQFAPRHVWLKILVFEL